MEKLQKVAQLSAKLLYQYATEYKAAMVRYSVVSITQSGPFFDLVLEQPLASIEGTVLQINESVYTEKQFKPTILNTKKKSVRFLPADGMEEILKSAEPAKVFLVYDLRFLITRVEEWYKAYGDRIRLPSVSPTIDAAFECSPNASQEQRQAVSTILSQPFTYIWGAPGTGKTQFVLAQCLLRYAKARQPVLIVAPTNRAVEQMLYGIMPVLESHKIKQEMVLRLGTPTKEFAARYPKICENGALNAKIEEITALISNLEEKLQENRETLRHFDRFSRYLNSRKSFEESAEKLLQSIQELSAISAELANTMQELSTVHGLQREYRRQQRDATALTIQTKSIIASLEKKLQRYEKSLFRFFLTKNRPYVLYGFPIP